MQAGRTGGATTTSALRSARALLLSARPVLRRCSTVAEATPTFRRIRLIGVSIDVVFEAAFLFLIALQRRPVKRYLIFYGINSVLRRLVLGKLLFHMPVVRVELPEWFLVAAGPTAAATAITPAPAVGTFSSASRTAHNNVSIALLGASGSTRSGCGAAAPRVRANCSQHWASLSRSTSRSTASGSAS